MIHRICLVKIFAAALVLALAFLSGGCGKSGVPQPVQVTGTVTRGGRPVDSLLVYFEPKTGNPSIGKTDDDGKFTLKLGADRMGAIPGPHTVYFQYAIASPQDELAYQQGTLKLSEDIKVATTKYGTPGTSPLKVEVTAQDPQDIALILE